MASWRMGGASKRCSRNPWFDAAAVRAWSARRFTAGKPGTLSATIARQLGFQGDRVGTRVEPQRGDKLTEGLFSSQPPNRREIFGENAMPAPTWRSPQVEACGDALPSLKPETRVRSWQLLPSCNLPMTYVYGTQPS